MAILAAAVPLALRYAQKFNPDVVYSSQQKADIAVAGVIARVLRHRNWFTCTTTWVRGWAAKPCAESSEQRMS